MKRKIIQICFLSKNQEVLKLGEEIEARRREEDERRALMHELHEGRVKELEEKVNVFISKIHFSMNFFAFTNLILQFILSSPQ